MNVKIKHKLNEINDDLKKSSQYLSEAAIKLGTSKGIGQDSCILALEEIQAELSSIYKILEQTAGAKK